MAWMMTPPLGAHSLPPFSSHPITSTARFPLWLRGSCSHPPSALQAGGAVAYSFYIPTAGADAACRREVAAEAREYGDTVGLASLAEATGGSDRDGEGEA